MKFRNAEFELIKNNWNRQNFGSSASLSCGRTRVLLLRTEYYNYFIMKKTIGVFQTLCVHSQKEVSIHKQK